MPLNLPTGMFHKKPAGKSVGAKRKVRRLKQRVDGRRRGERGDMSNTWTKIKERKVLVCV